MKTLSKKDVDIILDILEKTYPDAHCQLEHKSPFELLVATILSAQCTDERVNKVTGEMFKNYNKPEDFVKLGPEKIEPLIKSCGFYRNKAKNIYGASFEILNNYGGIVPSSLEELIKLPGVGRKTANVILSNCFGQEAIAVDTHVFRVTNRIGIVDEDSPEKTEFALMKKIKKERWSKAHHLFIFHGRRCCSARRPQCLICPIKNLCKWSGKWQKKQIK